MNGLLSIGSLVSQIIGVPRSILALLRGKGIKAIEFFPPGNCPPGDVTSHLRWRGIPNWGWSGNLPDGEDTRTPAVILVSRKQARWAEIVMLAYGCALLTPLEDPRSARYAEAAQERGGLRFWDQHR